MSGRHTDTTHCSGIAEVLEGFLAKAEVSGHVIAHLGPAVRGHKAYEGVKGVRVVKQTVSGVEVKAQTTEKSSRRVFVLNPPAGLTTDRFFAMLQKAENSLVEEPVNDDCVPPADEEEVIASSVEEDEEMRLTREGLAYIEQASGLHRKAEGLRRKISNLEREDQELLRRNSNIDREDEDFVQRLAEIERELELIKRDRSANRLLQNGNKLRQAAIADETNTLKQEIERIEAEAAHLLELRDERQRQIEELEHSRDIDGVVRKLEAELQGRKPEDVAEALRRMGFDLSLPLKPT